MDLDQALGMVELDRLCSSSRSQLHEALRLGVACKLHASVAKVDWVVGSAESVIDLLLYHAQPFNYLHQKMVEGANGGAAADSGSGKRVEHIGKADNKRHANSDYYKDWCERDTVLKVAPNAGDAVRVRCTPRRLICAARALALVTHVTDTEAFAHVRSSSFTTSSRTCTPIGARSMAAAP